MKHCRYLSLLIILLNACVFSPSGQSLEEEAPVDPVIHFADAVANMRPARLSEIADTVIFLPLETTRNSLIGQRSRIKFSSRHIFADRYVFDFSGKYICKIGRVGQGPGEDYINRIIEKPQEYYSGSTTKLIAYDTLGKYAGRERLIVEMRELDFSNAGPNVVVGVADSIIFLDTDFRIIHERRVVPPWPTKVTTFNINSVVSHFTENSDSVLYYNYTNDTIFRVLDKDISPRWIMDLKEEKIPMKHLMENENERLHTGYLHWAAGDFEGWDYLKDTDDRIRSFAVYETEHALIICWLKMREFWQMRNLSPSVLQVAWHNKITGETVAVEGEGFTDDLSSLGTFYPRWGTHDNYMITSWWPFELKEKVEKLESSGKPVDRNLKNLLDVLEEDDNPVLVLVRLKI
jgi:hypothetical protein